MARPRQPVAVLEANGRKHLSQTEIARREAQEVKVPAPVRVRAPKWLPGILADEFKRLGKLLADVGLYTALDDGVLGRYVIAQHEYMQAVGRVQAAFSQGDAAGVAFWGRVEDRYFNQCRACARELGLSISSRCALVIPMAAPSVGQEPDGDLFGD